VKGLIGRIGIIVNFVFIEFLNKILGIDAIGIYQALVDLMKFGFDG
jgi:hypothetical protein